MRREVDMFTEIERREKRQKLKGESVCRIIEINVEVAGNDEFVGLQQRRDKKTSHRRRRRMARNEWTKMENDRY